MLWVQDNYKDEFKSILEYDLYYLSFTFTLLKTYLDPISFNRFDGETMHFSLFAISIIYEAYKVNYYGKHPLKGKETKNRIDECIAQARTQNLIGGYKG